MRFLSLADVPLRHAYYLSIVSGSRRRFVTVTLRARRPNRKGDASLAELDPFRWPSLRRLMPFIKTTAARRQKVGDR
jgi:hypothetical protein